MHSVVVLNRNYEFWTEAGLKKVLKWLCQNKIEIVKSDESKTIGSCEVRVNLPLVVRLLSFVGYKPKSEKIPFSSEGVYNRDNNICQYWHYDEKGKKFKHKCSSEDRTIDHIVPVSRSGRSMYENCVCACRYCNEKIKKNRLPEEAHLELIRKPFSPMRDKNSFVIMRFNYNPNKVAHKVYQEEILGGKFSYVV